MSNLTSLEPFESAFIVLVLFHSRGLGLVPAWSAFHFPLSVCGKYSNLNNLTGETYQKTDAEFLDSEKDTFRDDGSTASTAVLVDNHLYVANVGDSRTVISKAGKGNI